MAENLIILLIEDEEAHIELIKRAFKPLSRDFNLVVAQNLQSAREELDRQHPDLIIADLNLPDGQCIELIKTQNANCPMIVLTGQGDEEAAVKIMKAGALDYIVKSPTIIEQIPQAVRRALREWQHIQKHNQAIEALKQSEEKYRTIVEEASDVIFIIDISGKIIDINASGTVNLSYSYNEFLKFNLKDILILVTPETDYLDFRTMSINEYILKEYYFKCADDTRIPFEISFRKLQNGKIIAIGRNITLRKMQEIEGKRNREELERFNRLAVGREMRMIELKKEVNQLLILLGQNEKYKIHSSEEILIMD